MMRRIACVAPFVLGVGCSRPIERPTVEDPHLTPRDPARPDASTDAPVIAAARPDAPVIANEGEARSPPVTAPSRKPPPPRPFVGYVILEQLYAPDVVVTLDRGSEHAVKKDWHGTFIDHLQQAIPDGACTIIRIDKSTMVCKTTLSIDQVEASRRVQLSPP